MRYLDHSHCTGAFEKGIDKEIKTMGSLSREATRKAEQNRLGLLKTRQGFYRIICECGLGHKVHSEKFMESLEEVDAYLRSI